jgi:hypothetical protein
VQLIKLKSLVNKYKNNFREVKLIVNKYKKKQDYIKIYIKT